jgi:hypothetical protein
MGIRCDEKCTINQLITITPFIVLVKYILKL